MHTDSISNDDNPDFETKLLVDYHADERNEFRLNFYYVPDSDDLEKVTENHKFGSAKSLALQTLLDLPDRTTQVSLVPTNQAGHLSRMEAVHVHVRCGLPGVTTGELSPLATMEEEEEVEELKSKQGLEVEHDQHESTEPGLKPVVPELNPSPQVEPDAAMLAEADKEDVVSPIFSRLLKHSPRGHSLSGYTPRNHSVDLSPIKEDSKNEDEDRELSDLGTPNYTLTQGDKNEDWKGWILNMSQLSSISVSISKNSLQDGFGDRQHPLNRLSMSRTPDNHRTGRRRVVVNVKCRSFFTLSLLLIRACVRLVCAQLPCHSRLYKS